MSKSLPFCYFQCLFKQVCLSGGVGSVGGVYYPLLLKLEILTQHVCQQMKPKSDAM